MKILFKIILTILKTKTVETLILEGVDTLYNRKDSPIEKKEKNLITRKVLNDKKR